MARAGVGFSIDPGVTPDGGDVGCDINVLREAFADVTFGVQVVADEADLPSTSEAGVLLDDPTVFTVTVDAANPVGFDSFTVDVDSPVTFEDVLGGVYDFEVELPAGYRLISIACSDGDTEVVRAGVGFSLDPGVTPDGADIGCNINVLREAFADVTFGVQVVANRQDRPEVDPSVLLDDPTLFTVTVDPANPVGFDDFGVSSDSPVTFEDVLRGVYGFEVELPPGYGLISVECPDRNTQVARDGVGFSLDPGVTTDGADVGCDINVLREAFADVTFGVQVVADEADLPSTSEAGVLLDDPTAFAVTADPANPVGFDSFTIDVDTPVTFEDVLGGVYGFAVALPAGYRLISIACSDGDTAVTRAGVGFSLDPGVTPDGADIGCNICLLYTSPSPRDRTRSRMPSSA